MQNWENKSKLCETLSANARPYNAEALTRWGARVGGNARLAANLLVSRSCNFAGDRVQRQDQIKRHFRADDPSHPFCDGADHWLSLRETQATKAFGYLLDRAGASTGAAFLKALVPSKEWPDTFDRFSARSEVPTRIGFIDILLEGFSNNKKYGAVIEVKFDHHARLNPFDDYVSYARENVFKENTDAVEFIILGKSQCQKTRRMVASKAKPWRFVHWPAFLRRLDIALLTEHSNVAIKELRRHIWGII